MPDFEDVTFAYPGGAAVLRGFSLSLPEQGVVCLQGASGCGKTTLLRLLGGLEKPQSGRIAGVDGRRASIVFQEDRLLEWETVGQNAVTDSAVGGRERAGRWLEALGLADSRGLKPAELSGGMRRRVAIARALAAPHDYLLLDEPFTGLDESAWRDAAARIRSTAAGRLVVLVTHLPTQAAAMGATVIGLAGPPLTTVGT